MNGMEMVGKLLEWLVLEGIIGTKNLHYKHVGLFSDNTAAVLWKKRGKQKFRSSRTSTYSLIFVSMSGKSITVSG